ncbi:AMP-binding protein [Nocardioides sp. Bht2]|uniref:AMP-binding protein n=1 Tax=Nocardioides sp. Bht2 TaxID=3392297 RepID=UPI0039B4462F
MQGNELGDAVKVSRISSAEVIAKGDRFAKLLDEAGIPRDATIVLLSGNRTEFLWCLRGASWSGRNVVPMSCRWGVADAAHVLADSGAACLVADAGQAELATALANQVPAAARFVFGGSLAGFQEIESLLPASAEPCAGERAGDVVPYTSGTTGQPKGVVRAPRTGPPPTFSALRGAAMLMQTPGADSGTHLVCTPLYHSAPLFYADGAVHLGNDVVVMERFDAEALLAAIEEHQVASMFVVPTQLTRMLALPEEVRARYDLTSLRLVMHSAAPISIAVKRAAIEWLGPVLYEFYGGSEGGGATGINSADWLAHPGSVGRIISGAAIRILDEEGNQLPAGVEGQIWFEGGESWEYRDAPEKTAAARRPGMGTLGDIGYLDGDGYLYLCDRRTDLVISGGVNVYPAQVEGVLQAHPGVADVCVFGTPDPEWGQVVTAAVHPAAGQGPELVDELIAWARERLGGPQVPRRIVLTELVRTETGKLSRGKVRDALLAQGRR